MKLFLKTFLGQGEKIYLGATVLAKKQNKLPLRSKNAIRIYICFVFCFFVVFVFAFLFSM